MLRKISTIASWMRISIVAITLTLNFLTRSALCEPHGNTIAVTLKDEQRFVLSDEDARKLGPMPYFTDNNKLRWTLLAQPLLSELCPQTSGVTNLTTPQARRRILLMRPRVDVQTCAPQDRFPAGYDILVGLDDSAATVKWTFVLTFDDHRGREGRNLLLAGASSDGIIINGADKTLDVISPETGKRMLSYPIKDAGLSFHSVYDSSLKRVFAVHRAFGGLGAGAGGVLREYRQNSSHVVLEATFVPSLKNLFFALSSSWLNSQLTKAQIKNMLLLEDRFLILVQKTSIRGVHDLAGVTIFDLTSQKFIYEKRLNDFGALNIHGEIELARGRGLNFGILYYSSGQSLTDPQQGYRLEHYLIEPG